MRTASSPILQELHDPEEVERERQAIARRYAEEMARNNRANGDRTRAVSQVIGNGNDNLRGTVFERISHQRAHVSERLGKNPDKAPQGWVRPKASQVASSNREPRQRAGRGGSQTPVRSLVVLDEEEVQSQVRVPAPQRLGPPQVPEAGEFQDLRQQLQEMQRKMYRGRVMIAVDASDALMCWCFLQTVDSKVADWVNHIPVGSIRKWDELRLQFLEHFAENCRPKKHFTHLASVRQKHGESLKNFLIRWRKESREVEGTDDKSRLAMFTAALQDGLLHTDLTTHPPDTFEEAMVRAGRYVTLEERKEEKKEKTPKEEEKVGNKKPFKNKKQGFPDGPKGTNPGTSEKHKSANPAFTLPVAEVMAHAAQQGLMTYPTYSQKVCNVADTGKWQTRIRRFGVRHLTSSPMHKVPNLPPPHGVGIASGSQRVSRAWYLKATKQPIKYDTQVGEVTAQLLRAEERRPRVEVAGDIEEVDLEPGTTLRKVISVLRRFRKVFAWSPADMLGLDHKIAVHRLNVLPDAKPVKQKRRHLLQERRDFVKKEVATLQSIGHIWEVHYPDCTVIVREENGAQHLVYYVSKTLRDAELRYSRPEKAMLAVFWTAKRLTPYFQAHRIVVLTNEPLASLTWSPAASARMTKWVVFIENIRIYYAIRFQFRVSNNEAKYEALINGLRILGKLGVSRVQVYSDSRLVVGQITGEFEAKEERMKRAAEAKALMEEIHEGVCAARQGPYSISRRAIIQEYFWPTMRKDCEEYVRKCPTCQQFQNVPGRPATNYTPISSVIPFSRWGIDIVGALPKEVGQARWIVVAIDYFTKWVEAEPLAGITGRQMIDFVGTNILCRFGVPKQIISDNGTQFEEAEFQDFLKTWGIQHTKVSVAYPQANGQVENVNRTIISGIKKKLLSEGSKKVDELPRILWTYRTTPRRATGDTPFGLAYGFEARAPAEAVIPTKREIEYDPEVNEQNQAIELNFVEE
ncbi:unnamed protein product [Cuscuta campestris]|uniref:Integrase catalytic domain-containing protein n=1 Tax=Cuscuta campestris TaxID=132261 RepID=A0A484KZX3_9ASTE|nr:unnamed protein product [Cuscuta campestris]